MRYDFVPMPRRKALRWPGGARIAVIVTLNLEYWDLTKDTDAPYYPGGPSLLAAPLPGNQADYHNHSWREYGQRVGIWRLIAALDGAGVPASCTLNAKLGLERRAVVEAVIARGWELVAHNFAQTDLLTNYAGDYAGERALIAECLRVHEAACGTPARGWLSSSLACTENTPEILAELGLIYHCDFMNDDQPYLVETAHGSLVEIPYTNEINDFNICMRRGLTTDEMVELLCDQFDELYDEGAGSGRLMNVGLHPHVAGQPFRARALADFLAHVARFDGVWWPSRAELAAWYLANHADHIG